MICVIADIRIKAGSQYEFFAAARAMLAATRAEPGCIRYDLEQNIEDAEHLTFVEEWETRDALAAHFKTEHMAEWRTASEPHLVDRNVKVLHVSDVEVL
ncbi:MAG: putative quinol monooxygenase [Hoeflea sp.]|uniref:putative quinol monooxygenase n=1 Tax=Hoeflea sp. TaxID=1940281 RepID=UPI0032ED39FD